MARSTRPQIPPALEAEWMTIRETTRQLGVSLATFYRIRREGVFRCKKYRYRLLVNRKDVNTYIQNLPDA